MRRGRGGGVSGGGAGAAAAQEADYELGGPVGGAAAAAAGSADSPIVEAVEEDEGGGAGGGAGAEGAEEVPIMIGPAPPPALPRTAAAAAAGDAPAAAAAAAVAAPPVTPPSIVRAAALQMTSCVAYLNGRCAERILDALAGHHLGPRPLSLEEAAAQDAAQPFITMAGLPRGLATVLGEARPADFITYYDFANSALYAALSVGGGEGTPTLALRVGLALLVETAPLAHSCKRFTALLKQVATLCLEPSADAKRQRFARGYLEAMAASEYVHVEALLVGDPQSLLRVPPLADTLVTMLRAAPPPPAWVASVGGALETRRAELAAAAAGGGGGAAEHGQLLEAINAAAAVLQGVMPEPTAN